MSNEVFYEGREQTLVKHFILQKYLERFAIIVGSRWDVLTYVDCFSGPWKARSERFEDSSFSIALRELRNARSALATRGRDVQLRCYFLEKNRAAHANLRAYADQVTDAEVETRNATLEESIDAITAFVLRGGANSFPFIFIDPKGWTGFEMQTIAPLLRLNPGEVLINFMTGHIRRFLESPLDETQESLHRLFGSPTFRAKVQGLTLQDREDAAVEEYALNVKSTGNFLHVCNAMVLHPEIDRTHFHLIYATRNPKGVEVFKDVEKRAMQVQEAARAGAHERRRQARTGQPALLASQDLHDSSHYDSLRDRYLAKSHNAVLSALQEHLRIPYEDAWALALSQPMTWESDLKEWVKEWQKQGRLTIEGMQPRQRVPQRGRGNFLVWMQSSLISPDS